MIMIATCTLLLALLVLIVRWFAAIPLVRTLTIAIDSWADSEAGPIRSRVRRRSLLECVRLRWPCRR